MSPILICFSSFESERSHDLEHGSSVETIVRMNEDDIDAGVVFLCHCDSAARRSLCICPLMG